MTVLKGQVALFNTYSGLNEISHQRMTPSTEAGRDPAPCHLPRWRVFLYTGRLQLDPNVLSCQFHTGLFDVEYPSASLLFSSACAYGRLKQSSA
jgi:hypothetical protein